MGNPLSTAVRTGGCSMQHDRRCQRCGKVMRTNVGTAVRMSGCIIQYKRLAHTGRYELVIVVMKGM